MTLNNSNGSPLETRLRRETQGEVLFDAFSRGRYSTDASIYQIEPLGVVVPRSREDAAAAIAIAREEGVPVLPRGAGTSQCGQTVARALVIDCSKHLDIDRDHAVEIFAAIDNQRLRNRLPALRGARTARQHRCSLLASDRDCCGGVLAAPRHDHPQRLDLVDRGIGRIAPAAESVEQHLAADFTAQARFEPRSGSIIQRYLPSRNDWILHQTRGCRPASISSAYWRQTDGGPA